MKVTIEGKELVVRIPMNDTPKPSQSGKTEIVAGTGGFTATAVALKDGRTISVNLTATVKPA